MTRDGLSRTDSAVTPRAVPVGGEALTRLRVGAFPVAVPVTQSGTLTHRLSSHE